VLCKHDAPRLFKRPQGTVAASAGADPEANSSNEQAMAMVSDRLNANKPPPTTEKGKVAPGQINNNKDLDVEAKKEEPGFFGSFWNQKAAGKQKKVGAATMESVSRMRGLRVTGHGLV